MRAGRLPEDHPQEQLARELLRQQALRQIDERKRDPTTIPQTTPEPQQQTLPKRWT